MAQDLTDLQLLHELEPVVEKNINRHLSMRKDWNPHDYIPWSDGKNYYALGGQDWDPEQSKLSEVAQVSMLQNLLTEDNLPSYHREIAMNFGMDGPWGFWVNRWTAEENRHGIALRDYLVVTRAIDPVELEQLRIEQVTRGFSPGQNQQGDLFAESLFDSVIYVTFQELATRVIAPQHRQGVRRDDRRPTAATGFGRREPAHDLLPRRVRRRASISRPTRRCTRCTACCATSRCPATPFRSSGARPSSSPSAASTTRASTSTTSSCRC